VPDEIRRVVAADRLRPPALIASSLLAMAACEITGATFLPGATPGSLIRYDVPTPR
jgi:hypothetical protein